jgi:phosphonoacetaldehyde hydrolase
MCATCFQQFAKPWLKWVSKFINIKDHMEFIFQRSYRGRLKAAILDWAGTTVDYGSFAPTAVFMKLFAEHGVQIKVEHARAPMGLMKKDHLRAIAVNPEVAQGWQSAHHRPMDETDIDAMFAQFVPMQLAVLEEYSTVIPGVPETISAFHDAGMKVGSTTGYTREMMEVLAPAAKRNGYAPDSWVAANDVPAGRPYPWMVYQNAIQMQVFPLEAYVKIGDTLPDIEEGLNAGMWTIGLAITGNLMGLTEQELEKLPVTEFETRRTEIETRLYQAGAHYVVDSLFDCLPVIREINLRLAQGQRP